MKGVVLSPCGATGSPLRGPPTPMKTGASRPRTGGLYRGQGRSQGWVFWQDTRIRGPDSRGPVDLCPVRLPEGASRRARGPPPAPYLSNRAASTWVGAERACQGAGRRGPICRGTNRAKVECGDIYRVVGAHHRRGSGKIGLWVGTHPTLARLCPPEVVLHPKNRLTPSRERSSVGVRCRDTFRGMLLNFQWHESI